MKQRQLENKEDTFLSSSIYFHVQWYTYTFSICLSPLSLSHFFLLDTAYGKVFFAGVKSDENFFLLF